MNDVLDFQEENNSISILQNYGLGLQITVKRSEKSIKVAQWSAAPSVRGGAWRSGLKLC